MGMKVNAADAAERRRARRTMNQLEEMSEYDWGYCVGMEGLMRHFGKLIAEQVRLHLTLGNRHHKVLPPVLEAVARYAEWHSVEHGDPENQHVAEALDAVRQAAAHAAKVVADHHAA
jgi:hypothetical protein